MVCSVTTGDGRIGEREEAPTGGAGSWEQGGRRERWEGEGWDLIRNLFN